MSEQFDPLLTLVHETIQIEEQEALKKQAEARRLDIAGRFAEAAENMVKHYIPFITKEYNLSYSYKYFEAGKYFTPLIEFETTEGSVDVSVEAEYEKTTLENSRPHSLYAKRIALILSKGEHESRITVDYLPPDEETRKRIFDLETLPSNNQLELGIAILERISANK